MAKDTSAVDEILEAIGEATSVIEDWCDRSELTEIAPEQAEKLRKEAEWLAGYVETFIEKAQPEPATAH